ncbi:MAG: nicotinate-nucleotide adenylyltransferase [Gammaproteobacteria bacterium]|nr:nicotinate-nucleotide adenylyltransferase [Gammaproteobacteria bacterium]MDH5653672.1 nicotinate-nucleotide adenylyltransferase [Gammaproteobacteria bacterium]
MIGIFGGTFDPVHFGHLRTALDVAEQAGLEQVRFIPCGTPAHRPAPLAGPEQRAQMLRMAIADQPGFTLDERELYRVGPSYMVDTLSSIRQELGAAASMGLILGMDAFNGLHSWHRWERLIELAHLLVMTRPGWDERDINSAPLRAMLQTHKAETALDCHAGPAGNVIFLQVSQLAISSTGLRQLIRAGRDIRYFLPDAVCDYIRREGLYLDSGKTND